MQESTIRDGVVFL